MPSSSRCRPRTSSPIPAHVDFVAAAAFPLTFLTAWHMLMTRAGLREGDVVLVLAGGSGSARRPSSSRGTSARASSRRRRPARRIARARSEPNRSSITTPETSRATIRALTGGRGADIVIEHVGEATWERSVRALATGGRLVTCGATTGHAAAVNLRHLFARQLSLLGSYMGRFSELVAAAPLLFDGHVDARHRRGLPARVCRGRTAPTRGEGTVREDCAGGMTVGMCNVRTGSEHRPAPFRPSGR